jgi:hypothetical protein
MGIRLHPDASSSRVVEASNAATIPVGYAIRVGRAMKYLKLIWLIMSGRLRIEHANPPKPLHGRLAPSAYAAEGIPENAPR